MIRRVQQARQGDDGFALILVTLMVTLVTMAVGAMLATTGPAISGAKRTEAALAARAAARSGIEDVVAYLVSIPSCRSQSQICPAALGASSTALAAAGSPRPTLASGQSYSWRTASAPTADGFVRVTSTGTYTSANGSFAGTAQTLVADLSLRPSILAYGYFTDYESMSPAYLTSFYSKKRYVYATDCTSGGLTCSASSPKFVSWPGDTDASACGEHWYAEGTLKGRAARNDSTPVTQNGFTGPKKDEGTAVTGQYGCDLVFSSAMVQDGKTFSRDAMLMSGDGPTFNAPVSTMWGYKDGSKDYTSPAPTTGQYYRGDVMKNGTIRPAIAANDLTLPPNIGKDGIPENACSYTGPTRVKLNGDGTATVTSPLTRTKNAASNAGCYPASVASGIIGFKFNYTTAGSGAIVVRNAGAVPAAGWPANQTKSINTPSANNEVFYFNAPGSTDVVKHDDKSSALESGCTATVKYSAAVDAPCAWTTVAVTTEGSAALGWTSYTTSTCGTAATTNRQLFECEYAQAASGAQPTPAPSAGKYKDVRDAVTTALNGSTCLTGTVASQASCVNSIVQSKVNPANSTTTVNGSRRYVATTVAGTATSSTVATGATGTGPDNIGSDLFFTQPSPAKETLTRTPLTTTVKRQVYTSSNSSWGSDSTAFTLTTTQSDYTYSAARGMTYFPNEDDVTPYNVGTDSAATAGVYRGTAVTPVANDRQPGDLYIDGANKGKLSVLADNDVIVTGNITNQSTDTNADAVSITAGQDVRNYHPVSCVDQDATNIDNTSPGWCPNDLTGLTTAAGATSAEYNNIGSVGDRTIYAVVFALNGSFGTDNYRRAPAVGNLKIFGGLYQSHRGGNGVVSGAVLQNGTNLQYSYVDLQRANLPYVPPSTSGNDVRPWNVVSISAG